MRLTRRKFATASGAVLVVISLSAVPGCSSDTPSSPSSAIALAGTSWTGRADDSTVHGQGVLTVAFEKALLGVTGTWAITFADPARNRTGSINEPCTFYCREGPNYEFLMTGQPRCEMFFRVHVTGRRMTGYFSVGPDNCLEVFRPEAFRQIHVDLTKQ